MVVILNLIWINDLAQLDSGLNVYSSEPGLGTEKLVSSLGIPLDYNY